MKKILLAVMALSLGLTTFAIQVHNEKKATQTLLLPDGPPPDCLPNCGQ